MACNLQETLRGRAALMVFERTDIADAAEADGVLLSPASEPLPTTQSSLIWDRSCFVMIWDMLFRDVLLLYQSRNIPDVLTGILKDLW